MRDALQGRYRAHIWDGAYARIQSRLLLRNLRVVRTCNMIVYMGLGFVERPALCYGLDSCGDPDVVPVSGFPVLPTWASQLVESICVGLFLWEMGLKAHYMRTS